MILLWKSGSIFIISIGFHSWDTPFCIDVKLARWSFWIGSILRNDMGRTHFHFLRRPDGALVSCEAYPPSNFPITKRIACWGGPPWQPYFARNALWVVKKLLELWGNDWTISIRWGNVNLCMIKWPTLLNTNFRSLTTKIASLSCQNPIVPTGNHYTKLKSRNGIQINFLFEI